MTRLEKNVKVQPTVPQSAVEFFLKSFKKPASAMSATLTDVAEFCDKHPAIAMFEGPLQMLNHALGLHRAMMFQGKRLLKGIFTEKELTACISVMNATLISNKTPGEVLRGNIEDVLLSELPVEVDLDDLRRRLNALGIFERAFLELWAWSFWYAPDFEGRDLKEYIAQLL